MKAQSQNENLLKWAPLLLVVTFFYQVMLSEKLDQWIHPEPYESPKTTQKMDSHISSTLRATAFLTGYKVLVGHVFWIQVIQYYGDSDNAGTRFSKLFDYCSLASDLNPQFVSIYTFGASALAFHLNRIEEAANLLKKGIKANPHVERLKFLLAAILYQHVDRYDLIIPVLEEEVDRSDAPPMLVNILANTFMKVGRYQDAIRVWKKILQFGDTDIQRITAAQKLQELYKIVKNPKS